MSLELEMALTRLNNDREKRTAQGRNLKVTSCEHPRAERVGDFYKYCPDCGAVNKKGEWHVCKLCVLPGAPKIA